MATLEKAELRRRARAFAGSWAGAKSEQSDKQTFWDEFFGIRHVSQNREWFTVAYESPTVIASDALFTVVDPDGFLFPILSSAMFMAWLRTIGGRIKSDLRFSGPMVYNTFPLPQLSAQQRDRIAASGKELIAARAKYPDTSLADLYNPLSTPDAILAAHRSVDLAVDRAFTARGRPSTVTDRMRILFSAYEVMQQGQ
jgi:hypothetical protein